MRLSLENVTTVGGKMVRNTECCVILPRGGFKNNLGFWLPHISILLLLFLLLLLCSINLFTSHVYVCETALKNT